MVACPQVCGYFYTVKGCFYTGKSFQALNKVNMGLRDLQKLAATTLNYLLCVDNR